MNFYDLTFSDGKTGRCIVMEPDADPAVDVAGVHSIFHDGYLASMTRVIGDPPARLPWKRDGQAWRLGSFELIKLDGGRFRVTWPNGSEEGGKDEISAAVRENWSKGI